MHALFTVKKAEWIFEDALILFLGLRGASVIFLAKLYIPSSGFIGGRQTSVGFLANKRCGWLCVLFGKLTVYSL